MGYRYRVQDLPVQGAGAFTPLPTRNPIASSWGLVRISGSPGTNPVSVPSPTKVWCPTPNNAPYLQGSNVAPDVWLPDVYYTHATNMGPTADAGIGMATRRHTPLPIPAKTWFSLPKRAMITPKIGGRRAMAWPKAFQRFPTISSGGGG